MFASPRNVNGALTLAGSGSVRWEKVISYYIDGEERLVKKEWLLDPVVRQSGFPPSLGAGFSTADLEAQSLPSRVMARGVEDFVVNFNGNTAEIRITSGRQDSQGREHKVRLRTGVQINN